MPKPRFSPRIRPVAFFLLCAVVLPACSSGRPSPKRLVTGSGGDLPNIQLINPGSSRTPPHGMSPSEYPFDSAGNYMVGGGR